MLAFLAIIATLAVFAYRAGASIDRRRRMRRARDVRIGVDRVDHDRAGRQRALARRVGIARSNIAPRSQPFVAPTASAPPEPGTLEAVFERIDALLRGER